MTSGPTDVGVLMAMGRKQMLSAFPPDRPLRGDPTLTRPALRDSSNHWAVLQIPFGDWGLTDGLSRSWFLGSPQCARWVDPPHVGNCIGIGSWQAEGTSQTSCLLRQPEELVRRKGLNNRPGACSRVRQCPQEPGRLFHLVQGIRPDLQTAQHPQYLATKSLWRACGNRRFCGPGDHLPSDDSNSGIGHPNLAAASWSAGGSTPLSPADDRDNEGHGQPADDAAKREPLRARCSPAPILWYEELTRAAKAAVPARTPKDASHPDVVGPVVA